MSDLFGNHIVGFPTRRLIYCISDAFVIIEHCIYFLCFKGSFPRLHSRLQCNERVWSIDITAKCSKKCMIWHNFKYDTDLLLHSRSEIEHFKKKNIALNSVQ